MIMRLHALASAATLLGLAGFTGAPYAAVSADEAKQLGTTLTEFGAIKAGNADGSIPPYTGGLTTPPPDFKPDSGFWADPFKDEKPILRIDAKNVDQYADKLSAGQIALIKKYPNTYYLNVYKSHRTAAYPPEVLRATVRNATTCKTLKEGLAIDTACRGGIPFPIPKTGYEAMWNQMLRYQGNGTISTTSSRTWVVDSSGKPTITAQQQTVQDFPFYQVDRTDRDPKMLWRTYSISTAPARRAGEMTGLMDFNDPTEQPRKAWSYTPGQRRIKLSPEFSYDTPVASMGGVVLFDELFVFSGKMDRFDFKLLGKKEMYIQYNGYKGAYDCPVPEKALMPSHVNPECERWELHRVWVVEATLKPGQRHVYSKRVYYFDEDLTGAANYDAFDQNGVLYRAMFQSTAPMYDKRIPFSAKNVVYDLNKGMYAYVNDVMVGGFTVTKALPERELAPEAIVGRETQR
ncbi:DUF1329 domain-containing protein [Caldimonas thermodepolymerans]|uniref:DUF1329 domain-containing protein n=1 Tax=Caldimonas thermodepolymerans TaxID=215580 RepID=UPI0022368F24|nr:DUF1329 domain-containing protein [Caldimonas thermodepolymerans]UZG46066.1 DUF1329 domain-containing protein [Caldimonas thermodepolymerans]